VNGVLDAVAHALDLMMSGRLSRWNRAAGARRAEVAVASFFDERLRGARPAAPTGGCADDLALLASGRLRGAAGEAL
jgi:hypothetical protein